MSKPDILELIDSAVLDFKQERQARTAAAVTRVLETASADCVVCDCPDVEGWTIDPASGECWVVWEPECNFDNSGDNIAMIEDVGIRIKNPGGSRDIYPVCPGDPSYYTPLQERSVWVRGRWVVPDQPGQDLEIRPLAAMCHQGVQMQFHSVSITPLDANGNISGERIVHTIVDEAMAIMDAAAEEAAASMNEFPAQGT